MIAICFDFRSLVQVQADFVPSKTDGYSIEYLYIIGVPFFKAVNQFKNILDKYLRIKSVVYENLYSGSAQ